ncbi:penicillin-binding protein 3 [Virgibacillus pantothenticus]|uniref:serine-type D-Ala-D-Ala carboxypeptidase n=1 Tax=Virgibacillus pantothenticus TaxID=1473 RepID=A0A0L0QMA0_VIRPA|nr:MULTISPECIES: penicillin-binding transpeptidase domain-containing protein [Virgibacillus]API93428.1 penicillin-binding protein [Virgibacillus sp. 6R]KNE19745.1 penicillin-binding protein [Virgibacillus pantothenticus]MBS7430203.1 penicillin-binding transpeptidase domain-containing protein [Virgibacillus sp. 19R1-5]MBU8566241.1 penicillin-binding transpeptidase domain-containing protein [Virgibacillus pantothenticus]MBU8600666.1 penicillin-binding transpeptidase domain-containing protein [Vi
MRKRILIAIIMLIVFVTACSDNNATPNDRFSNYINHWNKQEFGKMYKMVSKSTAESYPTEQFVDRYKKIYQDLHVSDLKIEAKELSKDESDKAAESGKATIPFTVSMKTMAGPISFDYEANLIKQGEDDEENWYIEWDPGFIFPEMKDGGELRIESTPPVRGEIRDRNEMPLAMNDIIYEVGIVPEKLGSSPDQNKKKIAQLLGLSVEAIDEKLNADWVQPNLFVPLAKITKEEEALWKQLVAIDGITRQETTGRIYPGGEATGALVGYIGSVTAEDLKEQKEGNYSDQDVIGKRGLEKLYEKQLRGEKGSQIKIVKDGEETVLAEKEAKDGENIKLTIDINVQEKIYQTLDGNMATVSAINAKTGETLGLVSSPSFNPNNILYGTTPNLWKQLEEDSKNPLLNRFSSTYAPGSVMKPITAAIGLSNGKIDPKKGLEINGLTWSNGEGWGDYEVTRVSESNGPVDLHDALVRSDNIYFAMQAVNMGEKAYVEGLKAFGLGTHFPFEYPITASSISASGKLDDEVLLANTSYGQGELEMSSLHLATAYTAFLNNGNMLKPTLLANEDKKQIWKEKLITPEQADIIKEALRDVVVSGTAKQSAKNADFPVSGKTGTAELKLTSDDSGQENGWFVGYPTDDEDIIVSVMIEEIKGKSGYPTEKAVEILNQMKE